MRIRQCPCNESGVKAERGWLAVNLPAAEHERLRREYSRRQVSKPMIVREALARYLNASDVGQERSVRMVEGPLVFFSMKLPVVENDRIQSEADRRGVPKTVIVREALTAFLDELEEGTRQVGLWAGQAEPDRGVALGK